MLSGQQLPRERGRMRVHNLQNNQIALNYIRFRKVKLVNIRPEDIVDGNQKLTLGLIWTIILHFQVSFFFSLSNYLLPSDLFHTFSTIQSISTLMAKILLIICNLLAFIFIYYLVLCVKCILL